jgi:RND family efflux transporter MFP subunit
MPNLEHDPMPSQAPEKPPAKRPKRLGLIGITLVVIAVAIAANGIIGRTSSKATLAHWTAEQAIPSVKVIKPIAGTGNQELVLPGNIEAFYEAPIYARVSGYVKMWYQDIGAKVKAGQLLAEIDTPDLDQQLAQAKADLGTAQATASLAEIGARRWQALQNSDSVSQQAVDEHTGDAAAKKANVAAAQANVQRLLAMENFKRITAPFDGVVTARKTDIGALINAGSGSGAGPELFSVADIHQMRVYVKVPQAQAAMLKSGMTAKLKLPQYPDRLFDATLTASANAVAKDSRSMLVELLADNPNGMLWSGTFAEVHLELPANPDILHVPTGAVLFRQNGAEVAIVGPDGKIALKPVELGRDLGTTVEIRSGIAASDLVVDGPSDSIDNGDQVKIADTAVAQGAHE